MKHVVPVKAEMGYDIRPDLPCQLEALFKAKCQADRIHIS